MRHVAVDFETFYDDDYSLKEMSTWAYVFDSRFNAYMVSVYDGVNTTVCDPRAFDWNTLRGARLDMHNASFDGLVMKRLQKDGVIPADLGCELFDTADMVAYMRVKRDLKSAAKYLLGVNVSKLTRSKMKGMSLEAAKAQGLEKELAEYAASDARLCWELAEKYGADWPEIEQAQSKWNREAAWDGFHVDVEAVEKAYAHLAGLQLNAARSIPWFTTHEDTPLSLEKIREQARRDGMWFPSSLAKDDETAIKWEDEFSEKFPWVKAIRDYRRVNMFLQRVKLLRDGVRGDGTFPYAAMYFGAATGRIQAGSGDDERDSGKRFNLFNIPRSEMFGVKIRNLIIPKPGHVFLVSDYAAIEGILLLWRTAEYRDLLDRFAAGEDLYELYARQAMGWTGGPLKTENPKLRQHAKVNVLACGYGIGAEKYRRTAKAQYGVELTEEEAKAAVYNYRQSNPAITTHWANKQALATAAATSGNVDTYTLNLVSGRSLTYWGPKIVPGKWPDGRPKQAIMAERVRGAGLKTLYGGLIVENEIQATARDIMRDATVALDKAGFDVVFTVYDEIVSQVPEEHADELLKKQEEIMISSSPWLDDKALGKCPLRVESHIMKRYDK